MTKKVNKTSVTDLEKKYMNILSEMTIGSKSFITLCKTAEITIKDNYQYYKKYLASKNKAAHGFENLIKRPNFITKTIFYKLR